MSRRTAAPPRAVLQWMTGNRRLAGQSGRQESLERNPLRPVDAAIRALGLEIRREEAHMPRESTSRRRAAKRLPCALLVLVGAVGLLAGVQVSATCTTYREMRYEGVVGQSSEYSCGPASVATLLSCFYGLDVSESDVLQRAEEYDAAAGREPGSGITGLALKRTLADHGIPARGLLVSLDALSQHFAQGGLPLILHLTRPQKHYLVAIGIVEGHAVLADPSWGRRLLPMPELERESGFDGVVLAPMPPFDLAARAAAAQSDALSWARERLAVLVALRDRMLWP
jgi:predicted double-glycine peptidase